MTTHCHKRTQIANNNTRTTTANPTNKNKKARRGTGTARSVILADPGLSRTPSSFVLCIAIIFIWLGGISEALALTRYETIPDQAHERPRRSMVSRIALTIIAIVILLSSESKAASLFSVGNIFQNSRSTTLRARRHTSSSYIHLRGGDIEGNTLNQTKMTPEKEQICIIGR